jgi:limonene-1,2-epoxide hydrolase
VSNNVTPKLLSKVHLKQTTAQGGKKMVGLNVMVTVITILLGGAVALGLLSIIDVATQGARSLTERLDRAALRYFWPIETVLVVACVIEWLRERVRARKEARRQIDTKSTRN